MTDIFLTGFMGTGKTSVGRILAQRYGFRFVDTDEEIERRTGKTVAEIFGDQGEAEFRALEHQVFADVTRSSGQIVALGGGTLMSDENRRLVRPDQTVLCLTCDPPELMERLGDCRERPLLSGAPTEGLVSLLERRRERYAEFPQIDTTGRSPSEVADEIARSFDISLSGELEFMRPQRSRISFRSGLLDLLGSTLQEAGIRDSVFLVTDSNVAQTGLVDRAAKSLDSAGFSHVIVTVPAGEEHKTLSTLELLYRECMQARLDRRSTIVALGGGMIGDLAGMLAATYLRGVELVQVPTTLLAQVDAAIGGKVAVDLHSVKNLVGAFYPARLVLIDPGTLATLPLSVLRAGMAEIVKIALMRSADLVQQLQALTEAQDVLNHPEVIRHAAEEKVRIVQADPYERGDRMLLNFGHTVGHGLEAASRYRLSHGEAISAGMTAELALATERGWSDEAALACLHQLLHRLTLPSVYRDVEPETVRSFIGHDKKRQGETQRFAVPLTVGRGAVVEVGGDDIVRAVDLALGAPW